MTTATLTFGSQYYLGRSSVSGGVTEVARQSVSKFKQGVLDKLRTASWQGSIITTLPALAASYKEAEAQAQFEDQALPSAGAMKEAQELLEALPHWCAAPVATIEPSGAIAFEWDMGPGRWLVLALKGTGTIEHSAVLGLGNERWGTGNFAGTLGAHERRLLAELMQLEV